MSVKLAGSEMYQSLNIFQSSLIRNKKNTQHLKLTLMSRTILG